MSTGTALLVALAGGTGAVLRLLLGRAVVVATATPLAAGTFAVNASGAFALGLLVGLAPGGETATVVGTGLLGGYTTFSTWMYESQRFAREGAPIAALVNLGASAAVGLAAIVIGRALAGG
jgi:CrcB protein